MIRLHDMTIQSTCIPILVHVQDGLSYKLDNKMILFFEHQMNKLLCTTHQNTYIALYMYTLFLFLNAHSVI